jgi:hypothetical protein
MVVDQGEDGRIGADSEGEEATATSEERTAE